MWPRVDGLRGFGLGTPGEMRDRLSALVLAGEKTATGALWRDEYEPEGEAIDEVGERQVMLDSQEAPLAIVEVTRVEQHRFDDVPWEFAAAEGEGFTSVQDWQDGHRSYYRGQGIDVRADDRFVCVWFRVGEVLGEPER